MRSPTPESPLPQVHPVITFELPTGDVVTSVRRRLGAGSPRVAIVAGIRGDAPEGIRVAHSVGTFLAEHEPGLGGTVDIYPCANPLAAQRGSRLWPFFDVDLNRLFPGDPEGHPPERVADALTRDVRGADLVIELRGARPSFLEETQAHVRAGDDLAVERAMKANVRVVWSRHPGPAAAGTFAHQFPGTIVLEGGAGNMLTDAVGHDLRDGVLNMLADIGVLAETDLPFHWAGLLRPLHVTDEQVRRVRASRGGLFLPGQPLWAQVQAGDPIGEVVDAASGVVREIVHSPVDGWLVAVLQQPVVYPGTMVARVVTP